MSYNENTDKVTFLGQLLNNNRLMQRPFINKVIA